MSPVSISLSFAAAFCVSAIAVAKTFSNTHTIRFRNAEIAAQVAAEMNQQVSTGLKETVLRTVRPEDRVAATSLLVKHRSRGNLVFYSVFDRLEAREGDAPPVFYMQADPNRDDRFVINGREWIVPKSGSILGSLEKNIFHKNRSSSKLEFLIRSAQASTAQNEASKSAALYFVTKREDLRGGAGVDTSKFLEKNSPEEWVVSKLLDFSEAEVQCLPAGAKGIAKIADRKVKFLAKDDGSILVQSPGPAARTLRFSAKKMDLGALHKRAELFISRLDEYQKLHPERPSRRHEAIAREIANFDDLCQLAGPAIAADTKLELKQGVRGFCEKVKAITAETLASASFQARETEGEKYISTAVTWLKKEKQHINRMIQFLSKSILLDSEIGTINLCEDADCDSVSSFGQYILPTSRPMLEVKRALTFTPTSSPGAKLAKIEYSCPEKTEVCSKVHLVNFENVSAPDRRRADELVRRANEKLRASFDIHKYDVRKPVSVLRALGPCCKDAECRKNVVGVKLVPSKEDNSNVVR